MEDLKREKPIAIVCVHGVAAHPRYEFQDQVSRVLCDRLNERDGGEAWVVDVLNMPDALKEGDLSPEPTISRVHHGEEHDAAKARAPFFDVIEAYWSPLSKNRTNWLFVLNWVLRIVFRPLNTTARYHASWQKQFFDYGYIGTTLVVSFALFFLSITAAWRSLIRLLHVTGVFSTGNSPDAILRALDANASVPHGVPVKIVVWLFVGVVGAFLVGQGLQAIVNIFVQRAALANNPKAIWHRVVAITVLLAVGGAMVYAMAIAKFPHGNLGWIGVGFLLLIFVAFQLGYGVLIFFLYGFLGDIQVYTTRDENDSRFYHARDEIIEVAVRAINRAISPDLNGGMEYDRVIVLAHSLGATIALDALVRCYQLSLQGAIEIENFQKIRAFVTAGSSIEKTRYFFESAGANPSASYEQWRADVYGLLFTRERDVMEQAPGEGIFWANYWYFQDPFCNEIRSFRSYLQPGESASAARMLRLNRTDDPSFASDSGGRRICWNERGKRHMTPTHLMLHSDYLDDPWFWKSAGGKHGHIGVLDVMTTGTSANDSRRNG